MSSLTTDLRSTLSALAAIRERLSRISQMYPVRFGNGGIVGGKATAHSPEIIHYGGDLLAETVHPEFGEFVVHAPYDIEELLSLVDRLLKDTEFYLAMRNNPCFPIISETQRG